METARGIRRPAEADLVGWVDSQIDADASMGA